MKNFYHVQLKILKETNDSLTLELENNSNLTISKNDKEFRLVSYKGIDKLSLWIVSEETLKKYNIEKLIKEK